MKSPHPCQKNITLSALESTILDVIPDGKSSAISARDIVSITGAKSRDVRAAVEAGRRKGVPVCSGNDGYWISDIPSEIRHCARSLFKRGNAIKRTAACLMKAARQIEEIEKGGITC